MPQSSASHIQLLQQVLETSFDSSWSLKLPSFELEYANKLSTENLLGYPIEKFYEDANFWFSIVHKDDVHIAKENNHNCLFHGTSEARYRLIRADGKPIWVLSRLRLIKDEQATPVRMIGSTMDVNEATIKEQQLRDSEERFHSLVRFVPIGIYITDLNGGSLYVNPAWENITDLTDAEAMGDNWMKVIHPDDLERIHREWQDCVLENGIFDTEFRFYNKKRGVRHVHSRAVPLKDPEGKIIGYVGTIEDITDRIVAEKILVSQREKLVSSAKMSSLGEMASGIAHEINNPLMIIVGLCMRLKRLSNDEEIYKDVERIESTTFRISKIIKGLRNFSRNSDKDPMERVQISKIIEDTLELSKQRFEDNHIQLLVDLTDCADVEIEARPSQITQVLLNLISNSFDAVENLDEKWVKISMSQTFEEIRITVQDSGTGIAAEVVEKMMNPFFTTKEVGKGTGLGLSISKGIIEEHRGKLYYDASCPHTCFVIQFQKMD